MTGPDHYLRAELLLEVASDAPANHDETNPSAALLLAEAQVHATLALAAATVTTMTGSDRGLNNAALEWRDAGAFPASTW